MHNSLGVDIIEWKKARSFYDRHRGRLVALFTREESRFVERSSRPHRAFAMLFAAKEAAFKALGGSWMGVGGFRKIRIRPDSASQFSFMAPRFLQNPKAGRKRQTILLCKSRNHVIAFCRVGGA